MHEALTTSRFTRTGARGLTLIELLVAVAILAMLILSFSMILSTSQRVVTASNSHMRKNTTATALSQILRADLRRVTQSGFMCIAETSSGDMLILTQAGLAESVTSPNTGGGSVVTIGLCDTDGMDEQTLFRQGWVLNDRGLSDGDMQNWDLSELTVLPREDPGGGGTNSVDEYVEYAIGQAPSSVTIPIQQQADLHELWQALAPGCTELKIRWTDGTRDSDGLKWYGPGSEANDPDIEYTVGSTDEHYRALWTNENQTNWPVAVKLTFTLKDVALPDADRAESEGNEYEVICTIGK
ncbi:MAG: type II secretion system protein J [Phycisphaerae bacterium]